MFLDFFVVWFVLFDEFFGVFDVLSGVIIFITKFCVIFWIHDEFFQGFDHFTFTQMFTRIFTGDVLLEFLTFGFSPETFED